MFVTLRPHGRHAVSAILGATALGLLAHDARAQPTVIDPTLQVTTWVSGLTTPTAVSFIGANDAFVLEKNSGRIQRVVNGAVTGTVLDLAVNNAGQRGLLGMALSPTFSVDRQVFVYSTTSSTGADTGVASDVPVLGNRVDRFVWDGNTLTFDRNLIALRAVQQDGAQPAQTSNNGGVMKFGTDGKLYVAVGDVGRRGWTQNLQNGPATSPPLIDDAFGGPAPDNAHLTGVVLRLNADGSAAADSPFFATGAAIGGEVGANVQKIFSYGSRNSFGMAFDPISGQLWNAENGDDAYDEINRVVPGANSGWIQLMGPLARFADFKTIETASANGLGQDRFTPDRLAADGAAALASLFSLPGSAYSDPEFSWRYGIAPSALGFLTGNGLGAAYNGSMFIGAGSTALEDGYLMRLGLTADRLAFDTSADPRLADLVADNLAKFGGTESETLLFGRGFGIVTDIVTGPNGHLFLTSLSNGAIYEIAPAGSDEPAVPASAPASIALLGVGLAALLRGRRGA